MFPNYFTLTYVRYYNHTCYTLKEQTISLCLLLDSVCVTNFAIAGTPGIACRSNESPLTGELHQADGKPILFRRGDSAIEIHARIPKERERERMSKRERERELAVSLGSGIRDGIRRTADPIKWYV